MSQSKTFHNAPRKNDPDINIWSATATNLFSSCLHKTKQILLLQQYNTNKMYSFYNLQLYVSIARHGVHWTFNKLPASYLGVLNKNNLHAVR